MKAEAKYNDYSGTIAADTADNIASKFDGDSLSSVCQSLGFNSSKFIPIGIKIRGYHGLSVSALCIKENDSENVIPTLSDSVF